MKINIFLILLLSLISASVNAGQDRSGGNTINGKLIEEYLVNPYISLPDFEKDMDTFIDQFKELPEVFRKFQTTIEEKNWYIVPVTLNELPFLDTGLNFPSNQLAYQNSSEIFFDENLLNTIAPRSRTLFYKHEVLMATFTLDSINTRNIMAFFVKNPNFNIISFRTMLRNYHVTTYLTNAETEVMQSIAATVSEDVRDICKSNISDNDKIDSIGKIYKIISNEANDKKLWYKDSEKKADAVLKKEILPSSDYALYKLAIQMRVRDNLGYGFHANVRNGSDIIDQCNDLY